MQNFWWQLLQTLLLVTALSLDALFAGWGYGLGGIRVPRRAALVVSLCCSLVLGAALVVGGCLGPLFSKSMAQLICAPLLALLGLEKIFSSALKGAIRKRQGRGELCFRLFDLRCILQIYADPQRADADGSRSLSAREAAALGVALSLDGAAAGVGAGLAGLSWPLAFGVSLALTFALVAGGARLGRRMGKKIQGDFSWLSGLLLLCMALGRWLG